MVWHGFSTCAEYTKELGQELGRLLSAGSLVLLNALTQGIARGLGVAADVPITSPTYTLVNSYRARLTLYHFDLYRLGSADELLDLGFDEYFHGDGVAVVEWAERCPELNADALSVDIRYVDESTREIEITAMGNEEIYRDIVKNLNFG